jgi:hypothetical protein
MYVRLSTGLALAIAIASGVAANAASIQTVYVSNSGSNVAGCGFFSSPCKGINYALTNSVATDGEIVVLDAGYATGPLAINKPVSIVGNGNITVIPSGAFGIRINVGTGKVVLKGITVDGSGGGTYGIDVRSAGSVSIADCVVHNFASDGILIEPNTALGYDIRNTAVVDNGGAGINIQVRSGGSATGSIVNVDALRNRGGYAGVTVNGQGSTAIAHITNTRSNFNTSCGFAKVENGSFYLSASTAAGNGCNITSAGGGGPGYSYQNNYLTGNTSDSGTAYLSNVSMQ